MTLKKSSAQKFAEKWGLKFWLIRRRTIGFDKITRFYFWQRICPDGIRLGIHPSATDSEITLWLTLKKLDREIQKAEKKGYISGSNDTWKILRKNKKGKK